MYNKKAHIHFVGIGGIGMSGIAHILKAQGYTISGCDLDLDQKSVQDLLKLGCIIYEGNNTTNCSDNSIDILVYSSAIGAKNPEVVQAQQRGIPTIARALMLAELMRTRFSIGVAGSHGKTTTTSLISHILIESNYDPTVIIGGHLKSISNNARLGQGDFLVAETDESDRSFLHLYPTLAVVTNIDREHLDTYADIDDIKKTFKQFLSNIPFYGKAIVCADDPHIQSLLPISHIKTIKYGIENNAEWIARSIILHPASSNFELYHHNQFIGDIELSIPGKHNILNTLAAIATVHELQVPLTAFSKALSSFKGIERRFSFKGIIKNAEFFDDYGHHPTEIDQTLTVARKRANKSKLIVIFQPHRYTRTEKLWHEFIKVFSIHAIDHLIITDIYAASEPPIPSVTGYAFAEAIQKSCCSYPVTYLPYDNEFSHIKKFIGPFLEPDTLVLLLGAGKMNKLFDKL